MNIPQRVSDWIDDLPDEEKAELAGIIFDEVDPTYENILTFVEQLTSSTRQELLFRLQDQEDKD